MEVLEGTDDILRSDEECDSAAEEDECELEVLAGPEADRESEDPLLNDGRGIERDDRGLVLERGFGR